MSNAIPDQPLESVRHIAQCRRREEILEKAIKLFAKHGYGGTDTQQLADELRVGKGTLYRYFPSKEQALSRRSRFRNADATRAIRTTSSGRHRSAGKDSAIDSGLPRLLRRASGVRRASDSRAGALQGSTQADLLPAPRGRNVERWRDLLSRFDLADGRVRPISAEKMLGPRRERFALRDNVYELLFGQSGRIPKCRPERRSHSKWFGTEYSPTPSDGGALTEQV